MYHLKETAGNVLQQRRFREKIRNVTPLQKTRNMKLLMKAQKHHEKLPEIFVIIFDVRINK